MRHLRAKQGRKTLNYFRIAYGVSPPYAVLLDGNFIHTATAQKIDIYERIKKHLGGEKFTLFVPSCVISELRSLGGAVEGALEFAQARCEVLDDDAEFSGTPTEAIRAIIGDINPKKYIVATQEEMLRDHLRSLSTGVPLMHIQRTVLLLETPSAAARHKSNKDESAKLRGDESSEAALARQLLNKQRADKRREDGANAIVPKREKAKGPNPLSCMKKKKTTEVVTTGGNGTGKKTRRGRKTKQDAESK